MRKKCLKRHLLPLIAALMLLGCMTDLTPVWAGTPLTTLIQQYQGTKWNDYYYGKQCKGFANLMFYKLWDVKYIGPYHPTYKYYIPSPSGAYEVGRLSAKEMSVQNVKKLLSQGLPGDFIQVRRRNSSNAHSMILVSTDANGVRLFDCNSDGKNTVKCYYQTWQQFYNKNRAVSLYRAYNNASTPTPTPAPVTRPSITNVGIDSISSKHITFHFTAKNAGLAKVVIESRNTGQSLSYSYTSGLDYVSHSFYTGKLPGTTEINLRIYAYTTTSGGNETLHNVLYGDTPDVVKFPQEYAEVEALCFDPKFYATVNPDIRALYGYNEEKLYLHWVTYGIKEGRNSSPIYEPMYYVQVNKDIKNAYGSDYEKIYKQFLMYGYREYRVSSTYYSGYYYKNRYVGEFKSMDSFALLRHYKNWGLKERRWANTSRYTGISSWK